MGRGAPVPREEEGHIHGGSARFQSPRRVALKVVEDEK